MSNLVYKNLKSKLEEMHSNNFAVEIGIYNDDDKIMEEKLVPLGNYLYDPLPSANEKSITKILSAKSYKY